MALTPFISNFIAGIGMSMGDEGKGRIIPEIAEELRVNTGMHDCVEMVLKVNGGSNSGHTAGGLKFNLLPSGAVEESVRYLALGCGVVADPRKILWEALPLEASGIQILSRLVIDERTMVSDVTHRLLDLSWEYYRRNVIEEGSRETTGRGISPAYCDESGQWQIYFSDFLEGKDAFRKKLIQRADRGLRTMQHVCRVDPESWGEFFSILTSSEEAANPESIKSRLFPDREFNFNRFMGESPFTLDVDEMVDVYWDAGTSLKDNICDVRELVLRSARDSRYVIGEFGQSYWLDKRHGFSPSVSASHTVAPEFFLSSGTPCQPIHTIGVCKAYDTKVGAHAFLTEMEPGNPLKEILGDIERGTTTGRQRAVGWFDAVEKGDAIRYSGFQCLVINKLDALTHRGAWRGDLRICTSYREPGGGILLHVPRNDSKRRTLQPVYRHYPGWGEDISNIRNFDGLPINAKRYIAGMLRNSLGVAYDGFVGDRNLPNLRYIGVGPLQSQIIKDVPEVGEIIAKFDPPDSDQI